MLVAGARVPSESAPPPPSPARWRKMVLHNEAIHQQHAAAVSCVRVFSLPPVDCHLLINLLFIRDAREQSHFISDHKLLHHKLD